MRGCQNGDVSKIDVGKITDFKVFKDVIDDVSAYRQSLNGLVVCGG